MLTKQIEKKDQLLPYYVLDVAGHIPGLSGLFIAGIFSAALSTLSANLNSLSGTIYEDFLKNWLETHHSQKTATYVLKLVVVFTGVSCTAMIFVVQHLGWLATRWKTVKSVLWCFRRVVGFVHFAWKYGAWPSVRNVYFGSVISQSKQKGRSIGIIFLSIINKIFISIGNILWCNYSIVLYGYNHYGFKILHRTRCNQVPRKTHFSRRLP